MSHTEKLIKNGYMIDVLKEKISDLIYEHIDYMYCDNCRFNSELTEESEDACENCHRKYNGWSVSRRTSDEITEKIYKLLIETLSSSNPAVPDIASYRKDHACVVVDMQDLCSTEVIPCKECKWHGYLTCSNPDGIKGWVTDNDFCSYVERREDAEIH